MFIFVATFDRLVPKSKEITNAQGIIERKQIQTSKVKNRVLSLNLKYKSISRIDTMAARRHSQGDQKLDSKI